MTSNKPYYEDADCNKDPILSKIKTFLKPDNTSTSPTGQVRVLEVGSGTGQHAVFYKKQMPYLHWQCTDIDEKMLVGIKQWLGEVPEDSHPTPVLLDAMAITEEANKSTWDKHFKAQLNEKEFDVFYTANVFHIMPWEGVVSFFENIVPKMASKGAAKGKPVKLVFYGAYNYNGKFTTESNARFDKWLKGRNPRSGVRDFERVVELAHNRGFRLVEDAEMPENNRLLMFESTH